MVEIQGTLIDLEATLTEIMAALVESEGTLINWKGRMVADQGMEIDRNARVIRVEGTVVDWMATPTKLSSATEPHNVAAVLPDPTAPQDHLFPGVALGAFVTES